MTMQASEPVLFDHGRFGPRDPSIFWHPVLPAKMDGLFSLSDSSPIEVSTEWSQGFWLFSMERKIEEDFLTSIYIYAFSAEPFKRIVFDRPGRYGLALLREHPELGRQSLRHSPTTSSVLSFGVRLEKEPFWRHIVSSRKAWYEALFEDLLSGGESTLTKAA